MDLKTHVVETLPHYLLLLFLMIVALGVLRSAVGEQSFWVELGVVLVIAFSYPPIVRRLGYAPSSWQRREEPE